MELSLNLGAWNSVFAVPCALVDYHIKLAGGAQLKVLLWILRHAGGSIQIDEISEALNMAAPDVKDSIHYWVETGLLASAGQVLSPAGMEPNPPAPEPEPADENPLPSTDAEPEPEPAEPTTAGITVSPPRPAGVFLAERIHQSEEIAFLMQECEQILGRAISPALSSILVSACDDYGLPVDVVIMLLAYVKSIGKTSSNYIESVIKNWSAEEITTHEKAEEKLCQLSQIAQAWRSIESTFGIHHRTPSMREEQFANRWICEWKFSTQMLREAYDRCVDTIGKMELKYINSILERWRNEGITTPEQAFWEKSEKAAERKAEAESKRTYDMEAYEKFDFLEAELPDGET